MTPGAWREHPCLSVERAVGDDVAVHRLTAFRRDSSQPDPGRGPLRMREPVGLIDPKDATQRLGSFVGAELTAVDVSMDRLVIAVATDPVHLLVISGPVTVTTPDGEVSEFRDPASPEALSAMDAWIGMRVEGVRVLPAGGLLLDSGAGRAFVEAGSDFEAWEVRGMDGGLLACLPGGEVSVWRPLSDRKSAEP